MIARLLLLLTLLLPVLCRAGAAGKTWVYEGRGSQDPGVHPVKDPDALDGEALKCPAATNVYYGWYTWVSGYTMDYVPGEYEVAFRVKVADNTWPGLLLSFGVGNGGVWEHVRGTAFAAPGQYQEFVYPFTITNPVLNICTLRRLAGPTLWIDRVTVTQKHAFTETEQLEQIGFKQPAEPKLVPHDGVNAWFAKGLYYQHYGLHTVLESLGAKVSYAANVRAQRGSSLSGVPLEGEPPESADSEPPEAPELHLAIGDGNREDTDEASLLDMLDEPEVVEARKARQAIERLYDHAMRYDLIVLCDVDLDCLSIVQRTLIADFVKAGGGLLIVGGPFALGRGEWDRSDLLRPLLPVTLTGTYDLQPLAGPAALRPSDGNVPKHGLSWDQQPQVLWLHRVIPKQGARVELTADGAPALITGVYRKGRVAVLAATVLGEMPPGQVGFWEWPDWPKLMTELVQWLIDRE